MLTQHSNPYQNRIRIHFNSQVKQNTDSYLLILYLSGHLVSPVGRYLMEERPHILELVLLIFLTNWRMVFGWTSH